MVFTLLRNEHRKKKLGAEVKNKQTTTAASATTAPATATAVVIVANFPETIRPGGMTGLYPPTRVNKNLRLH